MGIRKQLRWKFWHLSTNVFPIASQFSSDEKLTDVISTHKKSQRFQNMIIDQ